MYIARANACVFGWANLKFWLPDWSGWGLSGCKADLLHRKVQESGADLRHSSQQLVRSQAADPLGLPPKGLPSVLTRERAAEKSGTLTDDLDPDGVTHLTADLAVTPVRL